MVRKQSFLIKYRTFWFILPVAALVTGLTLWFVPGEQASVQEAESQVDIHAGTPDDSPVLQSQESPLPPEKSRVTVEKKVRWGDTIISILKGQGVEPSVALKLAAEVKPVYDLRKLNTGRAYTMDLEDGELTAFSYDIDENSTLYVDRQDEAFAGRIEVIPYRVETEVVKGTIQYSLFESIRQIGEKPELADILASLFEYDIDFNRDIREEDSFTVMVEKRFLEDKFVKYGDVLAAEFVNRGSAIRIVRYTDPDDKTAYYHPDGRSVRKMFLRCPLPFMRVTSRFGMRRHPVLGYSARHRGVDFGAPRGTRVHATASGVVKKTGYDRVMGRYIMIRHGNGYVTQYLHLNGIKKGIRPGKRVEQGQLIGFVGNTGRSTGPHLHYGVLRNSRHINPLSMKSPGKQPVKKAYRVEFKKHMERMFLMMSASQYMPLFERLQQKITTFPKTRLQQLGFSL